MACSSGVSDGGGCCFSKEGCGGVGMGYNIGAS